jgi:hypothetical protein
MGRGERGDRHGEGRLYGLICEKVLVGKISASKCTARERNSLMS